MNGSENLGDAAFSLLPFTASHLELPPGSVRENTLGF
jgi:hypothetical protein